MSTTRINGGDIAFGGGFVWPRISAALIAKLDGTTGELLATYGPPNGSGSVAADADCGLGQRPRRERRVAAPPRLTPQSRPTNSIGSPNFPLYLGRKRSVLYIVGTSTLRGPSAGSGKAVWAFSVLDGDHPAGDATFDEVHRDIRRKRRRHQRVDRIGFAAPEVVGQLRGERLDAGPLADLGRERLADICLVAMPERISPSDIGHLRAAPDGTLGGDDEGVVARVGGMVGGQELAQRIEVVRRFGDDAARRGHIRRVQR